MLLPAREGSSFCQKLKERQRAISSGEREILRDGRGV
jgi:hypothetical protein